MDNPLETFKVGRFTVKLYQDTDAESPAEWADKDGAFVVTVRNRYFQPENPLGEEVSRDGDAEEQADGWREDGYDVFPLYAYIHGGVSLSLGKFGCPRDSGMIGYVLVKRGEIPDTARAAASVVDTWNQYLGGDVYGYVVEDEDGVNEDACWGIYGIEDTREEARTAARVCEDHAVKRDVFRIAAGNLPDAGPDAADVTGPE